MDNEIMKVNDVWAHYNQSCLSFSRARAALPALSKEETVACGIKNTQQSYNSSVLLILLSYFKKTNMW